MSDYDDFLDALAARESGGEPDGGYGSQTGDNYLGKWQFGEGALVDTGYVNRDSRYQNNDYSGGWTGKDGVNSISDFLSNHAAQDSAIEAYMEKQWQYIEHFRLDEYQGQTIGGIEMTPSGMMAGAHLVGIGGLRDFLRSDGAIVPKDKNGTPITEYLDNFGGYDTPYDSSSPPPLPPRKPPVPEKFGEASGVFQLAMVEASPLVLDLDGDGVELTQFNSITSETFFDILGTGFANQTAWVHSDDGFLARDINDNGIIDGITELFGSPSVDGFALLDTLDSNGDHVINQYDDVWSDLVVWQDVNGDAVTQDGELLSLSSLNIVSFDLAGILPSDTVINGNTISHTSTYTLEGGTTRTVADAWFVHDSMNTSYVDDYVFEMDTLSLPTLRGYGQIADLHIAMSLDEELLDLVEQFALEWDYERLEDIGSINTDIEEILFTWAGVENVSYSARGPNIDARKLKFMEKLFGQDFIQLGEYSDPFPNAAAKLNEAWERLFLEIKTHLLVQVGLSNLFDNTVTYNPFSGELEGTMQLSQNAVDDLETLATSTITDDITFWKQVTEFLAFTKGLSNLTGPEATMLDDAIQATSASDWNSIQPLSVPAWVGITSGGSPDDDIINGTSGNDTLDGGVGNDQVYGHDGNDTLEGGAGDDIVDGGDGTDTVYGEDGNDTLYGGNGADSVYGGDGNDVIYGNDGNDNLYAGTGGNTLYGGYGDDTYFYEGGNDVYDELTNSGTDTIKLASGIVLNDLTFSRHVSVSDETLFIDVDSIGTIETKFFSSNSGYLLWERIETITFFDTSTYTLDSFTALTTYGTNDDDYINGIYTSQDINDTIYGMGGNDDIQAGGGNDTLDGGDGNDTLKGGLGDDTYLASAGFDIITFETGGNDTLVLPDGIDAEDVSLLRRVGAPDTLEITITGLGQVRIADQFYSSGDYTVETLSFNGVSSVSLTDLQIETIGSSGNDTLSGITSGASIDDILDGREGDDTLSGAEGDDTYFFSSGTDNVLEWGGTDTVRFRAGVLPTDITLYRGLNGGSDYDDLFVEDLSGNKLIINDHFSNSYRSIEYLVFSDNTTWVIGNLEIETHGTSGADIIDDVAFGDASLADKMYGYGGDDQLLAGDGNDILYGGDDNDILYGEAGNDLLSGDAGDDIIDGGEDNDTISYASAASGVTVNVATTTGQNTGGAGTDTITNVENIIGSAYNDTLTGDGSANVIEGGAGNDTLNGAGGTDTLSYENAGAGITINLATATGQNTGGAGTDTISNFENLRGSAYNDTLTGTSGNNVIEGGAGNDTINGQGGTDTLTYANASGAVTVSLAVATAQNTVGAGTDTISNMENLTGSAYGDTLTGSTAANTINGGDGDDTIEGGAGNDTLIGGSGTDTVSYINAGSAVTVNLATTSGQNTAGAGTDTISGFENLRGSAFNDTLTGNNSNNTIEGGGGNDTINGAGGTDTVSYASAGSAVTVNLATTTGQNTVGAGTDTITNTENLTGSGFNDTLTGNSSANTIMGGAGNDTINGGGGNDFLYGGAGTDTLTGSTGGDVFVFENATAFGASDTITDFNTAQVDKLNISDLLDAYDPLNDAISDFVRITDNGTHSFLSVDADGGGNSFTQIAQLSAVTNIAAGATATETELQAMITAGTLLVA